MKTKLKNIKLLILDVDGVLTDGLIYYGNNNTLIKAFNIHDGLGIKLLQKSGVEVAIISGKNSEGVANRIQELGITHAFLGNDHKLPIFKQLKETLKLNDDQIAYMGDDLPDLPIMRQVAFAATVPQAPEIMKKHSHYVTKIKAGRGAVREVCELIMNAQDTYEDVIKCYFEEQRVPQ